MLMYAHQQLFFSMSIDGSIFIPFELALEEFLALVRVL